jgi:hypothetical protein
VGTAIAPSRVSDVVAWRRKAARLDVTARTDAVVTGVILARLETAVDRLEAVYQQWVAAAAEQPAPPRGKEDDGG